MYIEVAAHRGNVADYPENTMDAFESAYDIGADMIETDLHMTKDGEIVLIHDDQLSRTTDSEGRIRELTVEELKRADAGIKRGERHRGARIPTLRELLELAVKADDKMQFNFEFKDYFGAGEEFAKKSADVAIALIDEYGLWERSFFNSFDGRLLEYVEEKYGGRFRLHGFYPYPICGSTRAKLYCACLFNQHLIDGKWVMGEGSVNPREDFDAVAADGVRPWVGAGIRRIEDMVRAAEYGAELITSNEPAFMMNGLKQAGLRER